MEEQVLLPITNPLEMDLPLVDAVSRVGLSTREISRALASFVRSLLSGDSPYDRYVSGDRRAMGADAVRGLQLFRGRANCIACHVPPTLRTSGFTIPVCAWRNEHFQDKGPFHVTRQARDEGAFRTPTLREIGGTGPYMHDGSLATLQQVVNYYDCGGNANPALDVEVRALRLGLGEKQDLIAFLRALSGTMRRE